MKRFLCLLLILPLLLSLFSCGSAETETGTDTDTDTAEETYVQVDVSDVPSPLSINGVEVPYGLYRYYFAAVRYKYDGDDESYWDGHDYTEEIRSEVLKYIRRIYALKECAEKYGVQLTLTEKKKAEQIIYSDMMQYENESDYLMALDDNYLTSETYKEIEELKQLEEKLFSFLTGEGSGPKISSDPALVQRYLDNYVIRADHILIINDADDDKTENEALIKEIYENLKLGADFEELKEKYSEDDQTNADESGYYLAKGDISQLFSDTAFSLEEGQISEIIYAPYGYHIIKRLEMDETYIKENLNTAFLSFYQAHMFEEMLKKLTDKQNLSYDDSYYTYTPTTIK